MGRMAVAMERVSLGMCVSRGMAAWLVRIEGKVHGWIRGGWMKVVM